MTDLDATGEEPESAAGHGPGSGTTRVVSSGSVRLHVEEFAAASTGQPTGDSAGDAQQQTPVLLMHGWPDSGRLWRHQIPVLTAAGFRVIVPDLRGFGRSDRPGAVEDYRMSRSVADMVAVLDACDATAAHVVAHDWGAAVAWQLAMFRPERVRTLAALSVGHPRAPQSLRQAEMGWYQLFFQFEGIAEATLAADDWALLRRLTRNRGDIDRAVRDLSRPGALTASLNWYRANLAPRMPGPARDLPPVTAPTLGVWSTGDHHLDGESMEHSGACVSGPWRHEVIAGASHWIPVDAPDRLNRLLLDWLPAPSPPPAAPPPA